MTAKPRDNAPKTTRPFEAPLEYPIEFRGERSTRLAKGFGVVCVGLLLASFLGFVEALSDLSDVRVGVLLFSALPLFAALFFLYGTVRAISGLRRLHIDDAEVIFYRGAITTDVSWSEPRDAFSTIVSDTVRGGDDEPVGYRIALEHATSNDRRAELALVTDVARVGRLAEDYASLLGVPVTHGEGLEPIECPDSSLIDEVALELAEPTPAQAFRSAAPAALDLSTETPDATNVPSGAPRSGDEPKATDETARTTALDDAAARDARPDVASVLKSEPGTESRPEPQLEPAAEPGPESGADSKPDTETDAERVAVAGPQQLDVSDLAQTQSQHGSRDAAEPEGAPSVAYEASGSERAAASTLGLASAVPDAPSPAPDAPSPAPDAHLTPELAAGADADPALDDRPPVYSIAEPMSSEATEEVAEVNNLQTSSSGTVADSSPAGAGPAAIVGAVGYEWNPTPLEHPEDPKTVLELPRFSAFKRKKNRWMQAQLKVPNSAIAGVGFGVLVVLAVGSSLMTDPYAGVYDDLPAFESSPLDFSYFFTAFLAAALFGLFTNGRDHVLTVAKGQVHLDTRINGTPVLRQTLRRADIEGVTLKKRWFGLYAVRIFTETDDLYFGWTRDSDEAAEAAARIRKQL